MPNVPQVCRPLLTKAVCVVFNITKTGDDHVRGFCHQKHQLVSLLGPSHELVSKFHGLRLDFLAHGMRRGGKRYYKGSRDVAFRVLH